MVTLIILLILVAVSMTMLLGENGLITKAQQSSETFQIEQGREQINLAVLGMQTEKLSKGESCTFTAEDRDIGEVEIAFNNKADYAIAEKVDNQYIRKYRFIGDIYEDVDSIIYMKDKLGNEDLVKLKIGKIDNTSPTITNVKQEKQTDGSTKIIITANDINTTINQEGSRNSRICNNTR